MAPGMPMTIMPSYSATRCPMSLWVVECVTGASPVDFRGCVIGTVARHANPGLGHRPPRPHPWRGAECCRRHFGRSALRSPCLRGYPCSRTWPSCRARRFVGAKFASSSPRSWTSSSGGEVQQESTATEATSSGCTEPHATD